MKFIPHDMKLLLSWAFRHSSERQYCQNCKWQIEFAQFWSEPPTVPVPSFVLRQSLEWELCVPGAPHVRSIIIWQKKKVQCLCCGKVKPNERLPNQQGWGAKWKLSIHIHLAYIFVNVQHQITCSVGTFWTKFGLNFAPSWNFVNGALLVGFSTEYSLCPLRQWGSTLPGTCARSASPSPSCSPGRSRKSLPAPPSLTGQKWRKPDGTFKHYKCNKVTKKLARFTRYSNNMFHHMFKAEFVTLESVKVPSGRWRLVPIETGATVN